jgi:acyl-[acyl carrier protein]--UDP-N-acetylglucosamine O-acyltransferase
MSKYPIGENCFIFEDNTIQPFVRIEDNVILWSGNHIGHHSTIKSHNFISSHVVVSGQCTIEPNCFIGVNSTNRSYGDCRRRKSYWSRVCDHKEHRKGCGICPGKNSKTR